MNNEQGKIWYGTGIDNSQLQKDAEKAKGLINGIGNTAVAEGSRIDNSMKKIGASIAAVFTIQQAANFAKQVATIRGEFQQLEIAFTTMLKSKEKADSLMREIVEFAATTPFDLKGVASGAKQLLAYGFEADSIRENLTMLGNVAAGVGSQIGDIIYLYGTLNAQGKVMTKDLMQFAGRGIPIYKELATVMGVTEKQVMELASQSKISFQHIEQAFQNMVGESGLFHNLMQEQSKSITGQISNLGDAIDSMFNEIGQSSEGVISAAISGASYLVENYKKVGQIIAGLIAMYGVYKAAIITFNAIQALSISLSNGWTVAELVRLKLLIMLESAQKLLNKTMLANPYIAATMAVVSLVAALTLYSRSAKQAKTDTEILSDITREAERNITSEASELSSLKKILNDSTKGYDERKAALDRIKQIVPDYHGSLTKEGKLINSNAEALDYYVEKLKLTEKIRIAVSKHSEARGNLDDYMAKNKDVYREAVMKKFNGKENQLFAGERAVIATVIKLSNEAEKYEKMIDNFHAEMVKLASRKTTQGNDDDDDDDDKNWVKERANLLRQLEKEQADYMRFKEDLYFRRREMELSLLEDGSKKELELLELNFRRKLVEINRQEEDLLRTLQEHAEKEHKVKGKKGKFDKSKVEIPREQLDEFERMRDAEAAAYEKSQADITKRLLEKYRTYAEKKKAIEEKFSKDIAELPVGSDAVLEAKKQLETELKKLREDVLSDNGKGLLELYLYGDGSEYILSKIKEAFPLFEDITKLTINQLEEAKRIINSVEFTKEQLDAFQQAGIDVEALKLALEKAKAASNEMLDVEKWEKIVEIAQKLSSSLDKLGRSLSESGGALGEIGRVISGLSSNIDNITTIFDKNATKTDIISAGISGIADLYSVVAKQIQENKRAQEEWNEKILEAAHNAALARIELEAYRESNLFGVENPYSKAIAGAKEYSSAIAELNASASAMAGGQVQTGTKQQVNWGNVAGGASAGATVGAAVGSFIPVVGTLLGAAIGAVVGGITGALATKTVPVFESLSKKYGEIYNKDTFELNPKILEDYDKLDDATKKLVDNWKEIAEKAKEAQEQMRQNFADLAGDIGKQLSDELVDAFSSGNVFNAVDSFKDKVTTVIEDIISQLIFAQYFEQLFKDLEHEMMASFGSNGDQNLVDDLLRFIEAYQNSLTSYNDAMIEAQEALSKHGFDLFKNTRSAASKGFQSMSQDTANELNGRFTAIQAHTYGISESVKVLQSNSTQALKHLAGIESNTARLSVIERLIGLLKSGIDDINTKGIFIKG